MSLIVGQYYRGDPKQKPKQWGNISSVASLLNNRLYDIGLPVQKTKIAMPLWESCGSKAINYADSSTPGEVNADYTKDGVCFESDGDYLDINATIGDITNGDTLTFFCTYKYTKTPNGYFYFVCLNPFVSNVYAIIANPAVSSIYTYHGTLNNYPGGSADASSAVYNRLFDGNEHTFCVTSKNGLRPSFYVDDYKLSCNNNSGTISSSYYNYSLSLGGRASSTGRYAGGIISNFLFFNDVLSDEQYLALKQNKNKLWQPPTFRTYFDLAVTAGTAIDCTTGAVAVTGLSAAVTAGTGIDCTIGAVAVTGLPAAVTAGTAIDCTVGAVAVTGNQAEVSVGDNISCNTGIVNITGLQAAIQASTSVDCSFGAVAITGLRAIIAAGYTINCTAGLVGITGVDAGISAGTSIDCTFGAVAVTSLAASVISSSTIETPVTRQFVIKNENRLFTITNENRSFTII